MFFWVPEPERWKHGRDEWNGWVAVGCVGVIPSETIVCLCLGPVETEYVRGCECV